MDEKADFERANSNSNEPQAGEDRRSIGPAFREDDDARQLAFGFLVSPLVIPVALFVVFGGAALLGINKFGANSLSDFVRQIGSLSRIVVPIGWVVTFLVARPAISWLFARGRGTRGRLLMLGVVLGGVPFVVFFGYVIAWELWRAAGLPANRPVLGWWDTIDRLTDAAPVALVWLTAGIASGGATAGTFTLLESKRLDQ